MSSPPDTTGLDPTDRLPEQMTPIVGIGASAGGVDALKDFFKGLPPHPDMAFVVVTHLSPDHDSDLVPILQRHTDLSVQTVAEGDSPRPNTVFVLPPRRRLRIVDGQFHLEKRTVPDGPPSVIDTFFRSLADDQGQAGIGIILSGTGTDGTLGIRALKEHGALVMAQAPHNAKYKGMPRSAHETGLLDVIDKAGQLGAELPRYWSYTTISGAEWEGNSQEEEEELLTKIFAQLYAETGHDFSNYKRSMIRRRIRRRMAVHQASSLPVYLDILQANAGEAGSLFQELLISVTNFFRDPDAFDALADSVIPNLLADKEPGDQVRVWSAGCATGEEAYSLAMLFEEHTASRSQSPEIKIFATDPSPQAIRWAREGRYPQSIASDLSPERRRKHLQAEGEYYRVKQRLRDRVLFAEHDLLRDPPFSGLDLVVCRNVLIYFRRSIHTRVLRLFHYGLHPEGVLFLGPSGSVQTAPNLFSPMDAHSSLFYRTGAQQPDTPLSLPTSAPFEELVSMEASDSEVPASSTETLRSFHQEVLFEEMPSILVDQSGDIIHLNEPATEHLHYQGGPPSQNLLKTVPAAIRSKLRGALHRAFQKRESTGPTVLSPPPGDTTSPFLLWVRPLDLPDQDAHMAQVLLEHLTSVPPSSELDALPPSLAPAEQMQEELNQTKEQLDHTVEEHEKTTEELEASNEELRLMNEELQSKNEEIETNQAELRSINEQLKSTNQELKDKVGELEEANSDLRNLIQATNVATLFLDRDLCIEWYTPEVRDHFNIREADTGRPLSNFTKRLQYDDLLEDARAVLDTLQSREQEIRDCEGNWFLVRLRPYRSLDDKVEGVVITFVDITDRKSAELEVREERNFVESLLDTVGALIVVIDGKNRIVRFNQKCETITGYSAAEVQGASVVTQLVPPEEADEVRALFAALRNDDVSTHHEHHWVTSEGERRLIRWSNTLLTTGDDAVEYIIGTGVDITRRRQLEREITLISDKERQRIGQDLHDILASHLSGTAMMVQGIARKVEAGQDIGTDEVREISALVQDASEQVRKLSHSLMPLEIHGGNLLEGLENLARRQEELTDVTCTFESEGPLPTLASDIISHLYRIANEAVTNALKHGDPNHVDIRLRVDDDLLSLVVRDDGMGLPNEAPDDSSLGLKMMQYRSNLVGGRLKIDSANGGGTTVRCAMPVAKATQSPRSTPPLLPS